MGKRVLADVIKEYGIYIHKKVKYMRLLRQFMFVLVFAINPVLSAQKVVHVWEKQELTFTSANSYKNAYTDVTIWIDLTGPGFNNRVYGFWDGGQIFHLRLVATQAGTWTWKSGSIPEDPGLAGKSGSFKAIDWTDAEKNENPLRHGFIRATSNQHALEHADGTSFFIIGDTWYSVGTNRFLWYDDNRERPIGSTAGFKDYVRYRKAQGYNWVNVIAAFPNWMTDGKSWHLIMDDSSKTTIRSAWLEYGRAVRRTWTMKEDGRSYSRERCLVTKISSPIWIESIPTISSIWTGRSTTLMQTDSSLL